MKRVRGGEAGPGDNARVLRHLAKVTINPAHHARPRRATSARSRSASSPTRCCGGRSSPACGPSWCSRRASRPGARRATATRRRCSPSRCASARQVGADGARAGAPLARLPRPRGDGRGAADHAPARRGRGLPRPDRGRHGAQRPPRRRARRPAHARGDARRRAGRAPPVERVASRAASCWVSGPAPARGPTRGRRTPAPARARRRTPRGRPRRSPARARPAARWCPRPRLVSASVCLAEIATPAGSPWPRAKPARSISHAADVLTRPVRLREGRHARPPPRAARARAPAAPRTPAARAPGW